MNNKRIAAVAAAAVMVGGLSFSAFAEAPDETGYVYFLAEKSVIGQGLTVEPVKVEIKNGDKGIDIVKKCAEIDYTDGDWGPYIMGFKDTDTAAEVPAIIKDACKDWGTRSKDGYLSAYDYTAESGWNYFVNDEFAMVGIGDYEPQNNDVIRFSFTVYGYGADLGIDNSSWGGAAALVTPPAKAELTRLAADCENKDSEEYKNAIAVLGNLTAENADVDAAVKALKGDSEIGKSDDVSEPESSEEESSKEESSKEESSKEESSNEESSKEESSKEESSNEESSKEESSKEESSKEESSKEESSKEESSNEESSKEESSKEESSDVIGDCSNTLGDDDSNDVPETGVGISVTATAITAGLAAVAFAVLKKKNV